MKIIVLFVFVLDIVELATGKDYYTKPGQKAILDCGVDSFTSILEWLRGNDLIISVDKRSLPRKGQIDVASRSRQRQNTQLEISGVREDDAGRFSCKVDGKNHEHTLLVVSVSAIPSSELELKSEATLQCKVKGLNTGSTVQWKGPNGIINKQTFSINSVDSSHSGTWVCMITQDGITHNENLEIKVKEPAPTTTLTPTKSSKSNKTICPTCDNSKSIFDQFSWWVWVAVGVSCMVMVLLMVCVIVLCKRIRRRKEKNQRMKNGRLGPKKYCQCNSQTAAARPQQGRRKEKPSALPLQPQLME